jgi:hypothetical protein
MNRRSLLLGVCSALGLGIFSSVSHSQVRVRVGPRRHWRRRFRRRFRRFAFTRSVFGRPFWVVPVGLAVGWELVHRDRVVVVKEIQIIEKDGQKSEVAIVEDATGSVETVEILREDNADNAKELEGTAIAEDDGKP